MTELTLGESLARTTSRQSSIPPSRRSSLAPSRSNSIVQIPGGVLKTAQILHPPKSDSLIDIILVPAIGSDIKSTFHRSGTRPAPVESLYSPLIKPKGARVLPYSYPQTDNSTLSLDKLASELLQFVSEHREPTTGHSKQPLHFAAHSTGGLVVKRALVIAGSNSKYIDISESCFSVAFFGVPHYGSTVLSDSSFEHSLMHNLHLNLGPDAWNKLRRLLRDDNDDLSRLRQDFGELAGRLRKIWSFVETQDTAVSKGTFGEQVHGKEFTFIVDNRSAKLEYGNESVIDVFSNHQSLCKFAGPRNSRLLKTFLSTFTSLADEVKNERDLKPNILAQFIIYVYSFYKNPGLPANAAVKVLKGEISLEKYLHSGPDVAINRRLQLDSRESNRNAKSTNNQTNGLPSKSVIPQITTTSPSNSTDMSRLTEVHGATRSVNSTSIVVDQSQNNKNNNVIINNVTMKIEDTKANLNIGVSTRDEQFKWIHVPCNSPAWALEVLDATARASKKPHVHQSKFNELVSHSRHNLRHYDFPHSRRMRPTSQFLDYPKECLARQDKPHASLVVYMPYLHWDTMGSLRERTKTIAERRKWPADQPFLESLVNRMSLEYKILWQFLHENGNLQIHHRRSLDQFGYPTLASTETRDRDQVLFKGSRMHAILHRPEKKGYESIDVHEVPEFDVDELSEDSSSKEVDVGKILMVDQLWLFVTDDKTVITLFTPKEEDNTDKGSSIIADLHRSIYNDVNGDPRFATQCTNPFELAALAVRHSVQLLLHNATEEDLRVFDIFEAYIGYLKEAQARSFARFRETQKQALEEQNGKYGIRRPKQEEKMQTRDNVEDLKNLTELKDVQDELSSLDQLFTEQNEVVDNLLARRARDATDQAGPTDPNSPSSFILNENATNCLNEAKESITQFQGHVNRLKNQCKLVQQDYEFLLDAREKKQAQRSAKVAEDQNRAIISLTVFTIIFLPLSFLAGIFGMNVWQITGDHMDSSLGRAFVWMFSISAAVIIVALLLAFYKPTRVFVLYLIHSFKSVFDSDRSENHTGRAVINSAMAPALWAAPHVTQVPQPTTKSRRPWRLRLRREKLPEAEKG